MIQLKRVYEQSEETDGFRILVDRIWPRGISKERASLDLWLKEIGPTKELRQSFHSGQIDFASFRKQYLLELATEPQKEALNQLAAIIKKEPVVTLVFAAKNSQENQAVVLKEVLSK
ncbi:DUF488 domain-containing protein [Enterococcus sp. 2201sp1_2201st1_B8_2201SCRN_220225]|uniref:DUF488 domain-containing protein n=1 Tax=unclassified Enterococcus TaxID=2608891 RepID=UPI0034A4AC41